MNNRAAARLFVLCGPTAVGRGTIVGSLYERYPSQFYPSVSATTRQPRPGGVEDGSYFFVPREEFQGLIDSGSMLEWAEVHQQNLYGTPAKPVDETLAWGLPVLLEIDLGGFRQVKAVRPGAHSIFLLSSSWEELRRRLIGRSMESTEGQHRRLKAARVGLVVQDELDELIVNDSLADVVFVLTRSMGLA